MRGEETALGNLISDIIRIRLDTNIAILNGGTVRVNGNMPVNASIQNI